MGAGKTIDAIVVVNTVPRFRRVLVLCMASAVEKVWVEHIRRWQTRDMRITPIHAENAYDIGTIPSGWVILNYSLLKKHHDGLRAKEWDLIIIDEGQALKTWNSVRTMNVFGGRVDDLDDKCRSSWPYQREITSLADTYSFSNYATNLTVDLNPGAWTNLGTQLADLGDGHTARGNIANALLFQGNTASLIENAIGGFGDDTIIGNQAVNRLEGNDGNDTLDGRLGGDTMIGGQGNDTYVVDAMRHLSQLADGQVILVPGDTVIENANEGIDTVQASVNYTLPANVEYLRLTGVGDVNGTGNALNNLIWGSDGNNIIDGGLGADMMQGFLGNDTYIIDNVADFRVRVLQ
jgi:hypothetical protein